MSLFKPLTATPNTILHQIHKKSAVIASVVDWLNYDVSMLSVDIFLLPFSIKLQSISPWGCRGAEVGYMKYFGWYMTGLHHCDCLIPQSLRKMEMHSQTVLMTPTSTQVREAWEVISTTFHLLFPLLHITSVLCKPAPVLMYYQVRQFSRWKNIWL